MPCFCLGCILFGHEDKRSSLSRGGRCPCPGHKPVGLEYEEVSLAPVDVRPRWPGGFLEALLAEQL